jgi:3-deoxy-manno-octulosonate cytidylyltransferase (CMP-KDO synthetase)
MEEEAAVADRWQAREGRRANRVVAVIPARYGSTRLPGKPLLEIGGLPLILHVVRRAAAVARIDRVVVATDDQRIADVVTADGREAMMTSPHHPTGTDRLAEVAAQIDADILINLQGDEPLIAPETIEAALTPLLEDPSLMMSTTSEPIGTIEDLFSPHVVKVVTDQAGFALYFSRQPIPFPRAEVLAQGSLADALRTYPALLSHYRKHTGLYVYRRPFLLSYAGWARTPLEALEALEQLRVLEHGVRLRVVPVEHRSIGIDTLEDLILVRELAASCPPA